MLDKLKALVSTPTAQLGRLGRFFVFQIKLWSHCARLLRTNRAGQQAAALSYHTIFGIVPLAIVVLLLFQLFPASEDAGKDLKTFIYEQMNLKAFEISSPAGESMELTEFIDQMVISFFTKANTGTIGIASALIVIWVALGLLGTIERAFNNIWQVSRGRSFLNRMINYWALLTLGPLLLGAGIYATTRFSSLGQVQETVLSIMGPLVLSYVIAVAAFFLLYFVLPNTKVKAKAALWGAVIAALVWVAAKNGFAYYVKEYEPYKTMYGVLALVPITVFWIYVTWLIVLFGLELTFTTQHLKTLDAAEIAAAQKREEHFIANDVTAINVVRHISAAFQERNAPAESEVVASKLNMPAELTERILNHLVGQGLLVKTSDPKVGFMPATDPANIRLSDISVALAAACFAQQTPDQPKLVDEVVASQKNILGRHNVEQMLCQTREQ
jgi:membrane protein